MLDIGGGFPGAPDAAITFEEVRGLKLLCWKKSNYNVIIIPWFYHLSAGQANTLTV